MKKVIAIVILGTILTSCGSRWSCKKRYCQTDNKKIEKQVLTPNCETVMVKP